MAAKQLSQGKAAYRQSELPDERCNECHFYIPGPGGTVGSCDLVEGGIDANFVSDLFRSRNEGLAGQGPRKAVPIESGLEELANVEVPEDV